MSSDDLTARPTIETVLERINQLGEQLRADIQNSREELINQIGLLRKDVLSIDRKIGIINKELLEVKADQSALGERVEKLEQKPS
jgi:hypothetical protein